MTEHRIAAIATPGQHQIVAIPTAHLTAVTSTEPLLILVIIMEMGQLTGNTGKAETPLYTKTVTEHLTDSIGNTKPVPGETLINNVIII